MSAEAIESRDLDRSRKSSSPLSAWTHVFPDPTSPTEGDNKRLVFTIFPDDNAEHSPRPPKPELSRLEANGMVNLFSSTERTRGFRDSRISKMEKQNNGSEEKLEEQPVHLTILSSIHQGKHYAHREENDYDDGFVIVTDKITQTDNSCSLTDSFEQYSNQSSEGNCLPGTKAEDSNIGQTKADFSQQCRSNSPDDQTLDNNNDITSNNDNSNGSEAPTLKVEYVGKVWDAYVNEFLMASDHISEAAIYDKATESCIACSQQFSMSDDEFNHLLACVNCLSMAYRCGLKINNRHFRTVLADGRRGLMAKGENHDGFSACQTRTLVLLAVHDRTGKGRRCNEELMRLGDFFWAKGL